MMESYRILWHLTALENQAGLSKLEREQLMTLVKAANLMDQAAHLAKTAGDRKAGALYLAITAAKIAAENDAPMDFRRTVFKLFSVAKFETETYQGNSLMAKSLLQKEIIEFETTVLEKFSEAAADGEDTASYDSDVADDSFGGAMGEVSEVFMAQMPHPEKSAPTARYHHESYFIDYYGNPTTIGEELGLKTSFTVPQLAVVRKNDNIVCIVRIEESFIGTSALGALLPTGEHRNYGASSKSHRNTFLGKVAQVLKDIEGGR